MRGFAMVIFCDHVQGRIDQALDGMDPKDINERRRGDLDKFLTTTNTKAAVFRDIIIESGVAYYSSLNSRSCPYIDYRCKLRSTSLLALILF